MPYAILHACTFDHDVLSCCCCGGGRRRVKAVVADPDEAMVVLATLSGAKAQARGPPVGVSSGAAKARVWGGEERGWMGAFVSCGYLWIWSEWVGCKILVDVVCGACDGG